MFILNVTRRYAIIYIMALVMLSACSVDSSTTDFHAYNPMINAQATVIAQKAMDDAASAALLRHGIEQQVRDEAFKRGIELAAQQAKNVLEIRTATNAEADVNAKRDAEIKQLQAIADTEVMAQPAKLAGKSVWYFMSWTGAGVGLLVFAVGMAFALVAWTNKRATTIYPNKQGQFPVIVRRGLGWVIFHDPSRAVGPGAVYRVPTLIDPLMARLQIGPAQTAYPLPDVSEQTLLSVSSQSNATAAIVAHNRWPELPAGFMARNMRLTTSGQGAETLRGDLSQPQQAYTEQLTTQLLPSRVPLRGLLSGVSPSLARLVLGVTATGDGQVQPVFGDLANMVHVLAAGGSGWGKSQFMRTMVYQLATASEPCSLVLADMERVTFGAFGKSDRLMFPIVDMERDLTAVLAELAKELDRRKELFAQFPEVDNLTTYNARVSDQLAPVVLAVDEATQFLSDGAVADGVKLLARRGRKYGIWLMLGGQTFSSKDLETATSLQFSSRVQFRAPVKMASQTLVDDKEAKALECPGRAILILPGKDAVKIQVPTIGYDDIVAALEGRGPQRPMPEHAQVIADDGLDSQIRLLAGDGMSRTEIARKLFGSTGGAAFYRVKRVLDFPTSASTSSVEVDENQ